MTQPSQNPISKQRTDEWEKIDSLALEYHAKQWDTPKQSTKAFEDFARSRLTRSKRVLDLGSGAGASTAYLAQRHCRVDFTGLDYSNELITLGSKIAQNEHIGNLSFEQGDWFNLTPTDKFDGVVSLQTLSWLPEYETPLLQIFKKLNPQWIALTSLFYEGDITCWIEVEEHKRSRKSFYNVYSIPAIKRLCAANGYAVEQVRAFQIDIDIDRPSDIDLLGTYTKRTLADNASGFERLQISGPLLMNWYMLLIEKK